MCNPTGIAVIIIDRSIPASAIRAGLSPWGMAEFNKFGSAIYWNSETRLSAAFNVKGLPKRKALATPNFGINKTVEI